MARISREQFFIESLELVSKRATCNRAQVGCIIVKDSRIISSGYNGSPMGMPHCIEAGCLINSDTGSCDRTIHAEVNAIAFAAKYGIAIQEAELYCSLSPCLNCAKLIINSGIKNLYILKEYRKQDGVLLLREAGIITRVYRNETFVELEAPNGKEN